VKGVSIKFTDNSAKAKSAMNGAMKKWLYEASAAINSQVRQNTAVKTGQLKGSWETNVDETKGEAQVGSPLENAIWEEFGTGEYAQEGNGRKGGWVYVDEKGQGHFTYGKKPKRALHTAFESKKTAVIRRAEEIMKSEMK
jgi:hypothetical protein